MSKHTPGPWKVGIGSVGRKAVWAGPIESGYNVKGVQCISTAPKTINSHEEAEANARLIAAAPELLAALRDLQHQLHNNGLKLDVRKHYSLLVADAAAGKAIAKAEGT